MGGEIGRRMDNNENRVVLRSIDDSIFWKRIRVAQIVVDRSSDFASFVNRYDFNDDCQERYEDCTETIHD